MSERLPKRFWPWLAACREASHHWGVDVSLILAVLDRESHAFVSLQPKGPSGTGDFKPRLASRYEGRKDIHRFFRWLPSRDEYRKLFPRRIDWQEVCLPADRLGWGRGGMQLDWAEPSNEDFLSELLPDGTPAWQDGARNIDAGTGILARLIKMFGHDEGLAAAANNAGPAAVSRAISGLTGPVTAHRRHVAADQVTTGKNYCTDVLSRRDRYAALLAHRIPAD